MSVTTHALKDLSNVNDIINALACIFQRDCTTSMQSYEYYQQQARWIIQAVSKKSCIQLISADSFSLDPEQWHALENIMLSYSNEHKPLEYIIGSVAFLQLNLKIQEPILIPRSETEAWLDTLIGMYQQAQVYPSAILDMCTGSGALALGLAYAFIGAKVVGVDNNPQAIALAQLNAQHNLLKNVSFIQSDLFDELLVAPSFDLIVANPPYIDPEQWLNLEPSVRQWEDFNALVAADHGLDIIACIIKQACKYLRLSEPINAKDLTELPNIVIEIGYDQAYAVRHLMTQADGKNIVIHKDSAGNDRWISANLEPRVV